MEIQKYKKYHKIKNISKNEKTSEVFIKKGFYGLKVIEAGIITPKQLETLRRIITRITKRIGKIIINVCFNHALTRKPLLSRMGKGSGNIHSWISYVKKGKVLVEIVGISEKIAIKALQATQSKIALKLKIVKREIIDA